MAAQDNDQFERHGNTFRICRALPTFDCLADHQLVDATSSSIDNHLPKLREFDDNLPSHFHRKSQAAWLEFTCVTVHVCNLMTGSHLDSKQAAVMMQHIDLLYRADDFVETLVEAYGIRDISTAFETLRRCFQPYLDVSSNINAPSHGAHKIDSPMDELPGIEKPNQLEQDLRDVIERMHSYPINEAHEQDRQWYSLELYDFFVAQLQQLDSQLPTKTTRGQVHKWVTDVGARSAGTNYMFAMFSCLISAPKKTRSWNTEAQLYLAQEFAQQISVEFRLLNDIGGRVRDERDRTMSSCTLVQGGDYSGLMEIALHAASCSGTLLDKLANSPVDGAVPQEATRIRGLLDLFRKSVRLSGEIYMAANEPNRAAS